MIKNISSFIKLKLALSVGFLFSASNLVFGTWVAAIPGIKHRLGFTDASLGLSLHLSPLGALTGVALSTKIFSKLSVEIGRASCRERVCAEEGSGGLEC